MSETDDLFKQVLAATTALDRRLDSHRVAIEELVKEQRQISRALAGITAQLAEISEQQKATQGDLDRLGGRMEILIDSHVALRRRMPEGSQT